MNTKMATSSPCPGGTYNHAILSASVSGELRNQLEKKGKDCIVASSDARVYIEKSDALVYPDVSVVCGDPEMSLVDKNAVVNPVMVVEVLSKSNESYDRGNKFYKYRQLDSLREYVLVSQEEAVVESYCLEENGSWRITHISGLDQKIVFASLDIEIDIDLGQVYRQVKFEDETKGEG